MRTWIRAVGNTYLPALRLLICFAPAQGDGRPIAANGQVRHVETYDLGPPERACEPEQHYGTVARADQSEAKRGAIPAQDVSVEMVRLRNKAARRPPPSTSHNVFRVLKRHQFSFWRLGEEPAE